MTSKPYDLPVTPIDSALFDFDGTTFAAEASTLQNAFSIQRLFNDACDVGIAIRSKKTDKVVRFYLHHVERNQDEIKAWHFRPLDRDVVLKCGAAGCARMKAVKAVVFND